MPMADRNRNRTDIEIASVTRAQAVADELRRMIEEREFPPGAHLRQAQIAKSFGVSTTPVREAFTALAREGMVQQDAHRGVVVFDPSLEELKENYEIREVLEALATQMAAPKLTEDALDELDRIVAEMATCDPAEGPALNYQFHTAIYAGAGRPRLAEIIDNLRKASASYLSMTVRHYDPRLLRHGPGRAPVDRRRSARAQRERRRQTDAGSPAPQPGSSRETHRS